MLARLARWKRLLFVGSAVGAAAWLLPQLPRDRDVRYRLHDPDLRSLEVRWSAVSNSEGTPSEPLRDARWEFSGAPAPTAVQAKVSLPAGDYELTLTLRSEAGSRQLTRRVTLAEGESVTIDAR